VRGAAATGHHLDLVGAGPQHLPGGPPDLVDAVGHDPGPHDPVEHHLPEVPAPLGDPALTVGADRQPADLVDHRREPPERRQGEVLDVDPAHLLDGLDQQLIREVDHAELPGDLDENWNPLYGLRGLYHATP